MVDNGITPYIPKPKPDISKKTNVPEPDFYEDRFRYNSEKDVYICPLGIELHFRLEVMQRGKKMKLYRSKKCLRCAARMRCTNNSRGRVLLRWEHDKVLRDMKKRVELNREKVKQRQCLTEHIYGT